MKNYFVLVFCLFVGISVSQTDHKKNNSSDIKHESVVLKNDSATKNSKPLVGFIEGTIPTPESQGFTKSIINGKEVYTKEGNGIIIQYQPK